MSSAVAPRLECRRCGAQYPLGPMKAAMESMIRQWAEELGPQGIRANAVCAGLVAESSAGGLRIHSAARSRIITEPGTKLLDIAECS